MKKLLALLLAVMMVVSLAACGEAKTEEPKTEEPTAEEPTTEEPTTEEPTTEEPTTEEPAGPLVDEGHNAWVAHGQYLLADGTENSWNGKDPALYEASSLTAIALEDVKAIDENLYNALAAKEVKYLYAIDLIFGTNDAGWTTNFLKDGKLFRANGSYAFKVCPCLIDEGVYSEDGWIPDAKVANAESLTPDTLFMPAWQEEKDENGFDWTCNPVVTGGAGLYTLVIAQYTNASSPEQAGYGIGLVLKEAKEGAEYEEILEYIPADHTYGIIGGFEGSDWGTDVAMEEAGENTWTGEVTLKAGDEFKVRADGAWDYSWGTEDGGNCTAEADGTYVVTITFDADGNATVTAEAK